MRCFIVAIAAMLGGGVIVAGAPARAQEPLQGDRTTTQSGPDFYYAPFVWNGNALDQMILDARAELVPLHRPIRPHLRHRRRG